MKKLRLRASSRASAARPARHVASQVRLLTSTSTPSSAFPPNTLPPSLLTLATPAAPANPRVCDLQTVLNPNPTNTPADWHALFLQRREEAQVGLAQTTPAPTITEDPATSSFRPTASDGHDPSSLAATAAAAAAFAAPRASLAQIREIARLSPTKIRKVLLSAAKTKPANADALFRAASQRLSSLENVLYFDAIGILKAFQHACPYFDEALYLKLAEDIGNQCSKLSPTHILECLEVFEEADLRPKVLYVELLHNLIRLSDVMYAEEFCQCFAVLVRLGIRNEYLVESLLKAAARGEKEFR